MIIFAIGAACTGALPTIARGKDNKWGYYVFAACRFITGVGEAAIISLAYTIVDDLAPINQKTIYMAILMLATPLGVAAGIGITGFIAETRYWQLVFFTEAIIVSLSALVCLKVPFHGYVKRKVVEKSVQEENTTTLEHELSNTETIKTEPIDATSDTITEQTEVDITTEQPENITQKITENNIEKIITKKQKIQYGIFTSIPPLATNPIYVSIVGVSCIYGAITGALTFWVPSYLLERLSAYKELSKAQQVALVSLGFSFISFMASLLGTATGAFIVEKTGGIVGWKGVARAMFWCIVFFCVSVPFGMIAFAVEAVPFWMLFSMLFGAIFFVFCASSPFQVALIK